jgi:hypothetical protein
MEKYPPGRANPDKAYDRNRTAETVLLMFVEIRLFQTTSFTGNAGVNAGFGAPGDQNQKRSSVRWRKIEVDNSTLHRYQNCDIQTDAEALASG